MQINVHGLRLWEALDEILYSLEECRINGTREISIIHGYRHGSVIKDYIRSEGFLTEMAKNGFILKKKGTREEGITQFRIKWKKINPK